MFARVGGEGTVVLLLHGAPSSTEALKPLALALASHHRVVVPELPGYGWTPARRVRCLEQERDELVAMLRRLGVTRLHAAIGNSLGAYRALDLAVRSDIIVERLGILAGFGDLAEPHRQEFREISGSLAHQSAFEDSMRALMAERAFSSTFRERHRPEIESVVCAALDSTTPAAFAAELLAMAASPSLLPAAAAFAGRTAIRVGELDVMTPLAYSAALGEALRTPPTIVPGVGHVLLIEDADASVAAMLELVRS